MVEIEKNALESSSVIEQLYCLRAGMSVLAKKNDEIHEIEKVEEKIKEESNEKFKEINEEIAKLESEKRKKLERMKKARKC